MIYACDNCHYLFSETNVVACPDCGKTMVRPATPAEQEDFENRSNENLWMDETYAQN